MTRAGVDVGGSGIRAQVESGGARGSSRIISAIPRDNGHIDIDALATLISRSVSEARSTIDAPPPDVVCVGMSGLPDLVADPTRLGTLIGSLVSARRVLLASDAVTTHVGALELVPGTVVAAGTGVVALGTDLEAVWNRTDGWGLLLGDEGGGAWVGQQGVIAALRAADGRQGGSGMLLDLMRETLGPVDHVVSTVYASPAPSYLLGGFAPSVAAAAVEGDSVAQAIWREAGQRLAAAGLAAATNLEPLFSWGGRLFDAGPVVLVPFTEAIIAGRRGAQVVEPQGSSTDGALTLARKHASGAPVNHPPYIQTYDAS
ncbi:BadF/BadG/BcrA/BcrD ATPase family protein [soil metagenome]